MRSTRTWASRGSGRCRGIGSSFRIVASYREPVTAWAARANIMIQQTGLMITSECNLLQPDADHERWPVLARGAPRDRLELSVCG
jgi:hypothetical protein